MLETVLVLTGVRVDPSVKVRIDVVEDHHPAHIELHAHPQRIHPLALLLLLVAVLAALLVNIVVVFASLHQLQTILTLKTRKREAHRLDISGIPLTQQKTVGLAIEVRSRSRVGQFQQTCSELEVPQMLAVLLEHAK